jgi:hypothetical protein
VLWGGLLLMALFIGVEECISRRRLKRHRAGNERS